MEGQYTFINFWFTDCPPCIKEIPHLNKLYEKYNMRVNFLSISRDDSLNVSMFLDEHEWNFTHLVDGDEIISKDFKNVFGYPTSFLLNKNSEIVEIFKLINEENFRDIDNQLHNHIK